MEVSDILGFFSQSSLPMSERVPVLINTAVYTGCVTAHHTMWQSIFLHFRFYYITFCPCNYSDCVFYEMPKHSWPTLTTGSKGILCWHWHRSSDLSYCKRLNQSSEVTFNYLNISRRKHQPDEKYIKTSSNSTLSVCDVIFTLQAILIQVFFPIGSNAFSFTEHLKKKQSQMICEVLSKQKSEVLPCSVMLAGPHCQSDRAAPQTSAPTLLSRTEGAVKRCQFIWQAKWDIFIRSSTPSKRRCQRVLREPISTTNMSYSVSSSSMPLPRNMFPIHFPCRQKRD